MSSAPDIVAGSFIIYMSSAPDIDKNGNIETLKFL
jgi:hypothetical protein